MSADQLPIKARRTLGVTLLAWLVLTVAVLNLIRFSQALGKWPLLTDLLPFSPLYLALSGLLWGGASLAIAWGLWRGLKWAPRFTRLAAVLYLIYIGVDRLFLVDPEYLDYNLPFVAVVSLAFVLWIYWVLSRKKARQYFGEMHERRS